MKATLWHCDAWEVERLGEVTYLRLIKGDPSERSSFIAQIRITNKEAELLRKAIEGPTKRVRNPKDG